MRVPRPRGLPTFALGGALLALVVVFGAVPARASDPPEAGRLRLPAVEPLVLPSGTRIYLLPDPSVPLVGVHVRLPGGVVHDAPTQAGRAALLAAWAKRGAGDLDATAFRRAVEERGGSLAVYAAARWIGLDAEFLAEDQVRGFGLVRDVLERPRFDPAELAKARDLALEGLKRLRSQPADAIALYADAWLFGPHPYGNPPQGDEASLARMADPDALRARWRAVAAAPNRWIAVTGDFDPAAVLAAFAGGGAHAPADPPAVDPARPRAGGVLLVDHPSALQTYLHVGGPGIDRKDPDHTARFLANTVLGGLFTSRLNTALRIRSGLTYGARSSFDDERDGAFAIGTYTETASSRACIDLALETYRTFVRDGIAADELASARAYIEGQFPLRNLETPSQRAAWLLDLGLSGLPHAFVDGFFDRLDALTLEEVNRVITTRFPHDPLTWVLVGRAATLREIAASLGPVTEIRLAAPGFGPRDAPAVAEGPR